MQLFKLGKAKVPHYKNTKDIKAVRMPAPSTVTIPLAQHIGAPATPVVNVGDRVLVGTLIGAPAGYVSASIHSSVSGTVKAVGGIMQSSGKTVTAVTVESDGLMERDPSIAVPTAETPEEFSAAILASGLVGLGGAGFPAHVKIDGAKKAKVDKIVINAAECEPYITSDTRTMLDDGEYLKYGIELLKKFIPADVIIGVENNKPEAITAITALFADTQGVEVAVLPDTYPQGGEKILIFNLTGRAVPEGGLPSDVGVLIMNVTSAAFVGKYFKTGMPLVEKRITVDGGAIKEPKNVTVPIGASIGDVIEFCGGFSEEPGKVLYGGPMMGIAVSSLDEPIMKNNNAITALSKKQSKIPNPTPCIHCGRCVSTCPMGLNPTEFAKAMNVDDHKERAEKLTAWKINLCIECGCCSFVCPAKRPLAETNKLAKAELREYLSNQKK